jgi:hypothetical protein
MPLVFIYTVARRLLLTPGSHHSCAPGDHSSPAFRCLTESARMVSGGYHRGKGDIPPEAGFANRLLVRIARLPRPFRRAIGWTVYLALVLVMFVVTLMPVWWSQ